MPVQPEPAGYLKLSRSISWQHKVPGGKFYQFVRGEVVPIPNEYEYDYLIRQGYVNDPYKSLVEIAPEFLKRIRPGAEVVVIRNIGLGDVILVAAVVRLLAERYPYIKFSFATKSNNMPLFDGVPWVHHVYQISRMRGHFPAVLELRGFAERHPEKYDMERIDLYARFLLAYAPEKYVFDVPTMKPSELEWAHELLQDVPKPWVLFAVLSTTTHLRSLPQDQVHSVTAELMERGAGVIHVNPHKLDWPCTLNLTAQLNVRQLAAVTAVSDCIISPDTGLYHLAEAVGTPHVDLFSTWPPNRRVSRYNYAFPIWKGPSVRCCPCFDRRPTCTTLECFRAMSTKEICDRVEEAISRRTNVETPEMACAGECAESCVTGGM
jgi:ADP-heptose:LPS heptosyltransferase